MGVPRLVRWKVHNALAIRIIILAIRSLTLVIIRISTGLLVPIMHAPIRVRISWGGHSNMALVHRCSVTEGCVCRVSVSRTMAMSRCSGDHLDIVGVVVLRPLLVGGHIPEVGVVSFAGGTASAAVDEADEHPDADDAGKGGDDGGTGDCAFVRKESESVGIMFLLDNN
jgi:hypothetical protein